jgi:ribosome recycling factor
MSKITLIEGGPLKTVQSALESLMTPHIQHLEKELGKLRTGRAHPSMVEDIRVSCYGSMMPIKELGSISAPEAQLLIIQPWDTGIIGDIEKAIAQSDLGVMPLNDGKIIRIPLPKMSSSRRDELVKVLGKRAEECKIALRKVRQDAQTQIKDAEKNKVISQDYGKKIQELVQKVTDAGIANIENLVAKKEAEVQSL